MRISARGMIGVLILILIAAGCSGGGAGDWDPAEVQVELTTDPATVKAGEEVNLIARFIGVPDKPATDMRFDIPNNNRSYLTKGHDAGDGSYTLLFTFPEPGTYDIYFHYYVDGEHITKIKKLEVS